MKKFFLIFAAIALVGVFAITSCGKKNKWTELDKREYMKECVGEASISVGSDAEIYCSCMLEKIMVKYPDPKDAENITMMEIFEMLEDCMGQ